MSEEIGTECSSTEEMIRGIQDTNRKLEERKSSRGMENSARMREIVVISQDVKALYPSLDWDTIVKIIGKILEETEIVFKDINYRNLGKYLAVHMTPEEISKDNLQSVVPTKVKPNKVTIAFLDSDVDKNGIGQEREKIQQDFKRREW